MEYKDYYKVLGLERNATQEEVKRTYRKLARKFHPDINKEPTAEARFKEIGEAYEVRGDAEKRAAYDQLGSQWKQGQEFRPPPDWDAGFEFSGATSEGAGGQLSDFFDTLFGAMGRGEPTRRRYAEVHARGEDHHAKILIDLRDALEGATRTISLRVPEIDATGHVAVRNRTLNVTIPKGITHGQHIRLKGQDAPGIGQGAAGDLYLEVQLEKDALYRVSGKDLYLDLPLALWEAALGASVKVPTRLDGCTSAARRARACTGAHYPRNALRRAVDGQVRHDNRPRVHFELAQGALDALYGRIGREQCNSG